MRYKVVPEPRDVDFLADVQGAVPLVPGSVDDCCTRIRDRTPVASRDAAREWLTFLQALGLAEETARGYHRARTEPDRDAIAESFVGNVFPAREVLDVLEKGRAQTATEVFEEVRDEIPRWERERYADWEGEWHDRIERLLEWAVVFGLAELNGDAYRRGTE